MEIRIIYAPWVVFEGDVQGGDLIEPYGSAEIGLKLPSHLEIVVPIYLGSPDPDYSGAQRHIVVEVDQHDPGHDAISTLLGEHFPDWQYTVEDSINQMQEMRVVQNWLEARLEKLKRLHRRRRKKLGLEECN